MAIDEEIRSEGMMDPDEIWNGGDVEALRALWARRARIARRIVNERIVRLSSFRRTRRFLDPTEIERPEPRALDFEDE